MPMGVKCPGRPPKCWHNDIMRRVVRQMQRMTKVTTTWVACDLRRGVREPDDGEARREAKQKAMWRKNHQTSWMQPR